MRVSSMALTISGTGCGRDIQYHFAPFRDQSRGSGPARMRRTDVRPSAASGAFLLSPHRRLKSLRIAPLPPDRNDAAGEGSRAPVVVVAHQLQYQRARVIVVNHAALRCL